MIKISLNRRTVRLLLVGLIVIVILGLGYDLGQQYSARQEGMTKGLLTGVPCAPPCWQGFTPGTVAEKTAVLRRLRRMPGVGEVWVRELPRETIIKWFWNNNPLLNVFLPPWPGYNSIILSNKGVINGMIPLAK